MRKEKRKTRPYVSDGFEEFAKAGASTMLAVMDAFDVPYFTNEETGETVDREFLSKHVNTDKMTKAEQKAAELAARQAQEAGTVNTGVADADPGATETPMPEPAVSNPREAFKRPVDAEKETKGFIKMLNEKDWLIISGLFSKEIDFGAEKGGIKTVYGGSVHEGDGSEGLDFEPGETYLMPSNVGLSSKLKALAAKNYKGQVFIERLEEEPIEGTMKSIVKWGVYIK